jgi:agmatinase
VSKNFDPNAAAAPDSGIFGLSSNLDEAAVHVLPVPFDATASYRKGAWKGPDAVFRASSQQVDLFDLATGRPYEAGIAMLDADPRVLKLNRNASKLADQRDRGRRRSSRRSASSRKRSRSVNAIGSDEINALVYERDEEASSRRRSCSRSSAATTRRLSARFAPALEPYPNLGVLHFDAHADLRRRLRRLRMVARVDHGQRRRGCLRGVTRLVQVGIRDFCEDE